MIKLKKKRQKRIQLKEKKIERWYLKGKEKGLDPASHLENLSTWLFT